jgi:RNA polymerase primary sigma factor
MSKKFVNFDTDDVVSKYFKDIRKSVVLAPFEENELAKKIKAGDKKALDKLINANLKFVISIAKEYQGKGLPLADLINDGNHGLIKAAHRFDHRKGFKFISYAVWWIRQSILLSLSENARLVRLPANVIHKISKLSKEIAKFESQNEREPIFGEIVDDDNEAISMVMYPKHTSLNEVINEEGDEMIELILSEEPEETKYEVTDEVKTKINEALSILSDREREIIECYFGINIESEPMTLEAIGERFDLTKERIRQIKEKAIRKLRHNAHDLFSLINE